MYSFKFGRTVSYVCLSVFTLCVAGALLLGTATSTQANEIQKPQRVQPAAEYVYIADGGTTLYPGDMVTSPNGEYKLVMQTDGNLVLYDSQQTPLWASGTHGKPVEFCSMQDDGNLVIYTTSGQPIWASGTHGYPGSDLRVQDDGNVVIYSFDGSPIWATDTSR